MQVEDIISDAQSNGYGKTKMVDFFTHSRGDGPIGGELTGGNAEHKYNLSNQTRRLMDSFQMTLEGWAEIDFNFANESSLAVYHGCKTNRFASNFIGITNVHYVAFMEDLQ